MEVILIPCNDDEFVKKLEIDGSLQSLQELVGGLIQPLTLDQVIFLVDEEGKLKGYPVNLRANTYLYRLEPRYRGFDYLVGDVLLLGDDGESFTDVPEGIIKAWGLD